MGDLVCRDAGARLPGIRDSVIFLYQSVRLPVDIDAVLGSSLESLVEKCLSTLDQAH